MHFKTAVSIERPIEEVFDYVSDPRNFPRWNSAVQSVNPISGQGEPGSTYLMERELPGGRAENGLEVVDRERPTAFTSEPPRARRPSSIGTGSTSTAAPRSWS
jgi:uncharacterized protein YndB with AHSA1/START domain